MRHRMKNHSIYFELINSIDADMGRNNEKFG